MNALEVCPPAALGKPSILVAATYGNGVFVSTNDGNTWATASNGLTNRYVISLAVNVGGSTPSIFAGTNGGGIYRSTNNGANWTTVNQGLTDTVIEALEVSGCNVFASSFDLRTVYGNVFLSTDNGGHWSRMNTAGITWGLQDLAVCDSFLIGACGERGILRSSDQGRTWVAPINGFPPEAYSFAVSGSVLYAASYVEICRSTDYGESWTSCPFDTTIDLAAPRSVAAISGTSGGEYLFAGSAYGTLAVSGNCGTSWTQKANFRDLGGTWVKAIKRNGDNLFCATYGAGVYRRPLAEILTRIEDHTTILPAQFTLEQNYPNPFNPETTIRYTIPRESTVRLIVYNVIGQAVNTVIDEKQPPGQKEVHVNAARLASGVYFYRLQAGSFSVTRKMVVIR